MSKSEELEDKIKEQRTLEANKKGLMGQNGKIGTVLKILGQPIVSQSEGGFLIDSNYLDLENKIDQPNLENITDSKELMKNIPIMDVPGSVRPDTQEWEQEMPDAVSYGVDVIGMHFDGLNRGMHMEIKHDEINSDLVVYYRGYLVYKEIKGELLSYVPIEEWEKWIESLYKIAKEKQRNIKEKEFEDSIKKNQKEKIRWLERIRTRWGFT